MFYNNTASNGYIKLTIFLTDDGCTDGTPETVIETIDFGDLRIIKGDGNLFWAGGMRLCWNEALKNHANTDYYLLLNDDTLVLTSMFDELFATERYVLERYNREGIISGITSSITEPFLMTYGGSIWKNRLLATTKRLTPVGAPQLCDLTNANILLVPHSVVDEIGIFYEGYQHGKADYDYSVQARKNGIPVVLTAQYCGRCEHDHLNARDAAKKVVAMSLKERKQYFSSPIHSNKDYVLFVKRTSPLRIPFVWFGRLLNVFWPKLYYYISGNR